jgi:DNA-binding CsgD family transcriptional regulator
MAKKLNLDEQQVIQLAKDGLNKEKIAEMTGCSFATIYRVLRKHKVKAKVKPPVLKDRITNKIKVNPETGCWIYQGTLDKKGYGVTSVNGKRYLVHRLSYELYVGSIPDGMFICHKCDTPSCVCPEHLFAGTPADNARDMVNKGRQAKGMKNGKAKVNESMKARMIELKSQGFRNSEIANIFKISHEAVRQHLHGIFPTRSDITKLNVQKSLMLKSQGCSPKEISEQLGINIKTVRRYLKSNPEPFHVQPNLFQDS